MGTEEPAAPRVNMSSLRTEGPSVFTRLTGQAAGHGAMDIDDGFGIRKRLVDSSKPLSGKRSTMNPESPEDGGAAKAGAETEDGEAPVEKPIDDYDHPEPMVQRRGGKFSAISTAPDDEPGGIWGNLD